MLGSTGAENQYIIEGLNTTGIEKGQRTKQLNFDFVDEIELKTGGLPAEYGRMTGGVINVITKSGGNVFSGSVYAFNEGGKLMSNDSTEGDRPQTTTTVQNLDSRGDVGFNVGGYIVRDRLWFFGAYNPVVRYDADPRHPHPDGAGLSRARQRDSDRSDPASHGREADLSPRRRPAARRGLQCRPGDA